MARVWRGVVVVCGVGGGGGGVWVGFFFFNDTATTEIYTLSLHDALPISYPAKTISAFTFPDPPMANAW